MSTTNFKLKVALIDPVGEKAGMDHYDGLLLAGLKNAGADVILYSNTSEVTSISSKKYFNNVGVSKIRAVITNFTGFIRSLSDAKQNGYKWLLLHVFRAGLFDFVTFSIARMMGFKICAIVHDIESLDTYSLPIIRKTVLQRLPHVRTVHNDFSKTELLRSTGESDILTYVIPHMHFRDLFQDLHPSTKYTSGVLDPAIHEAKANGIPLFVFFGQIKRAKGIDLLLEAACQIKGDFRIVIAGKMREGKWKHYQQMVRALNLGNKIIPVIRHITDLERDWLFENAKAIVLPYQKIYQSGVLLMAMSFPTLVIISNLPPNREMVRDNTDGLLYNAGSSPDLARRMQEVLDGGIEVESLKKNAVDRMESGYSPDKIGRDYFTLLTQRS